MKTRATRCGHIQACRQRCVCAHTHVCISEQEKVKVRIQAFHDNIEAVIDNYRPVRMDGWMDEWMDGWMLVGWFHMFDRQFECLIDG